MTGATLLIDNQVANKYFESIVRNKLLGDNQPIRVVYAKLSDEQKALVDGYMGKVKSPVQQLISMNRPLYHACLAIGMSFEDIEQSAWLGVLRAAVKYDPNRLGKGGKKASFFTYAGFWVKQVVQRETDNYTVEKSWEKKSGRERKFRILHHTKPKPGDGSTKHIVEMLADHRADETKERAESIKNIREKIVGVLNKCVDKRGREIFIMLNGLDGTEPKTLEFVGDKFGIGKERVRQINIRTTKKIRKPLWEAVKDVAGEVGVKNGMD